MNTSRSLVTLDDLDLGADDQRLEALARLEAIAAVGLARGILHATVKADPVGPRVPIARTGLQLACERARAEHGADRDLAVWLENLVAEELRAIAEARRVTRASRVRKLYRRGA